MYVMYHNIVDYIIVKVVNLELHKVSEETLKIQKTKVCTA